MVTLQEKQNVLYADFTSIKIVNTKTYKCNLNGNNITI